MWLTLLPPLAHAQTPDWQEKRTAHFAITYAAAQAAEADRYVGFVDGVYTDLTAIFSLALRTPVSLRLFPDEKSYIAVNPLAARIPGVIAHATAGGGRREIAIAVERTRGMSDEALTNNVRHELTHLIVAELSGDDLPVGFHEGVAQYLEKPIQREQEAIVRRLRTASVQGGLMSWADLNAPGGAYANPDIAYPQSLSIVAFLVDRYGFAKLLDFIKAMPTSSGYRSALETAYGLSADQLEAQWREYLPQYLDGRYAVNALYAYDLAPARALLGQGTYTAAKEELDRAVYLLQQTGQADRLAEAQDLLARAERGINAGQTVAEARKALEARDYGRTRDLVSQARAGYAALSDTRREDELRLYDERAQAAQQAHVDLQRAEDLVRTFRYPEARVALVEAATALGELGDSGGLATAERLMAEMDARQRLVGFGFLGLGTVFLAFTLRRRVTSPDPQQGWL